MPEKLAMRKGGLEERIFGRRRLSFSDWWFSRSPRQLLNWMQMLTGGIWPSLGAGMIFLFSFNSSTSWELSVGGFATPLAVLQMLVYAAGMPLIACRTYNRIWTAQLRVRRILKESDIVLRILFGWQPDYADEGVRATLRQIEGREAPADLHRAFFQVGSQLSYWLGERAEPRPPLPRLVLIPLGLLLAGQLALIPLALSYEDAPELFAILQQVQFLGGLLAFHFANQLAGPLFEQHYELHLLREHLREIDNDRFIPRPVLEMFGRDDSAQAARRRVHAMLPAADHPGRAADAEPRRQEGGVLHG
ncbi:hypothetical protein KDL44_10470 [bacterium]|nr:hypothetical protein [bacterium]